ncbi:hypothetical protein [Phycisphaera mikurensis]|uniref:DUF2946 domain-containing protein n=1 Tax=Phycisphaera mikurensis (strain NBRC 102666 / KCTC 22515 / FYK2301M01) TaxID=1142394 RepID=I0IC81_PHYMF|nr:hypothetical protein [Phycisphaera mikurensis]MBB6441912.1 hypothetical protein [Phycisphaera mikurensis]BAM02869.1 hypothetical protein PSMK_07100 [Phycisphaera mikurensis NBRC 102666]
MSVTRPLLFLVAAALLLSLGGPAGLLHHRLAHAGGHAAAHGGHGHAHAHADAPASPAPDEPADPQEPADPGCTLCHALAHPLAVPPQPVVAAPLPPLGAAVRAARPRSVYATSQRSRPPDRGPPAADV